jgi:hypothetical protein
MIGQTNVLFHKLIYFSEFNIIYKIQEWTCEMQVHAHESKKVIFFPEIII